MLDVAERLRQRPRAPLTEELIHSFHATLTRNIDYEHNEPGKYRTYRVTVGRYIPPETSDDVRRLMSEFIEWFNAGPPARWNPVVRAIVAHFYVVSIHPFGDGNGRTSRAVESYLLYQAGINARGFYSLANYYYQYRSEYVRHLRLVQFRSTDDLTPFIVFALRGLAEELETVHREVLAEVRVISFRDFAREILSSKGKLGARGERVLNLLIEMRAEPVSLSEMRSRRHPLSRLYAGMSNRTFTRDIRFLEQERLVAVEGDTLRANLWIMDSFTA